MRIKRFVIDTNSLISAFILPYSTSRKALRKAFKEGQVIISEATLTEFTNVFIRTKFDKYVPLETRLDIIDSFRSLVFTQIVTTTIDECRDPKDNKFLELAISADADIRITGDADLLVLHPFREISILTATDFLNRF